MHISTTPKSLEHTEIDLKELENGHYYTPTYLKTELEGTYN